MKTELIFIFLSERHYDLKIEKYTTHYTILNEFKHTIAHQGSKCYARFDDDKSNIKKWMEEKSKIMFLVCHPVIC